MNSMSKNLKQKICLKLYSIYLGLIENIFLSRIAFSKASSSVGSPGSAQGSTSICRKKKNCQKFSKFNEKKTIKKTYIN